MKREEIEQLYVEEPNCFETGREEQWYKVGLKEGLAAADSHPQWIPVEERLPKEENLYIVSNGKETSVAYWVDDAWDTFGDVITHWMPLPQSPRKEDKG